MTRVRKKKKGAVRGKRKITWEKGHKEQKKNCPNLTDIDVERNRKTRERNLQVKDN